MAESTTNGTEKKNLTMRDQVNELAENATQKVSQFGAKLSDEIDGALSTVGEKIHKLGSAIKEKGPKEGQFGSVVDKVGERFEQSGDYLTQRKLSDLKNDVTSIVRKFPVQSVFIGLGLGFFFGNLITRKRK